MPSDFTDTIIQSYRNGHTAASDFISSFKEGRCNRNGQLGNRHVGRAEEISNTAGDNEGIVQNGKDKKEEGKESYVVNVPSMSAWHGSASVFSQFDSKFFNTGEGSMTILNK